MRQSTCQYCDKTEPMNEMLTVFGQSLCSECAENALAKYAGKQLAPGDVTRQADPTVCVRCQMDNGNQEYPLLAGAPVCESCEDYFCHRPYPSWLKSGAVVLLVLAAFAFVHNFRFVKGYLESQRAIRLLKKGTVDQAVPLMEAAAEHVPESKELTTTATFFRALMLLKEDKARRALLLLEECKKRWPADHTLDYLILQAELAAAFEDKDYDTFLAKAQAWLALQPNESEALAGVASAYACKYAVTGQQHFKDQALHYLDLAAKKGGADPLFQDYAERIRHCLETREIITRQEYQRRFPHGREAAKP